mgnify:FL=1
MKSFKYQYFLALLLAVVLLFSACSPGPATSPPSSSGAVEEQSPEVSSGTEAGGYPIVGEKITLTFLDACHVMQGDNSQLPLWKRMEELTNIHINLEVAPYSKKEAGSCHPA